MDLGTARAKAPTHARPPARTCTPPLDSRRARPFGRARKNFCLLSGRSRVRDQLVHCTGQKTGETQAGGKPKRGGCAPRMDRSGVGIRPVGQFSTGGGGTDGRSVRECNQLARLKTGGGGEGTVNGRATSWSAAPGRGNLEGDQRPGGRWAERAGQPTGRCALGGDQLVVIAARWTWSKSIARDGAGVGERRATSWPGSVRGAGPGPGRG